MMGGCFFSACARLLRDKSSISRDRIGHQLLRIGDTIDSRVSENARILLCRLNPVLFKGNASQVPRFPARASV